MVKYILYKRSHNSGNIYSEKFAYAGAIYIILKKDK